MVPPKLVDAEQVAQLVDHLVRRVLVELGGVGALEPADVARELDGRPLEAVADAEERHAVLARVFGGLHHPARAARSEAARHQDAVAPSSSAAALLFERLGLDPVARSPCSRLAKPPW